MYKRTNMHALSFICLTFLIITATALTDISLLNCPSSYLKSSPVQNQKGFVDFGSTLYSAYRSQSNQDELYKIIIQGDTQQLDHYSTILQIPYIVIGVIFIIIMMFVISWCLFSRSCPPWQWTKRNPFLQPYTKKQMKYTLFWLIVFAVAILIISILIISEIPALKNNIEHTKCSIFVTIDTALNGGTSGWAGFRSLKNNIGNISSLISSTTTQIGLYFTGDDWLKNDVTIMKTKNNMIYEENQDAQMISPNPFTTATQIQAGFPAPRIDSLFIKRGLGPNGQSERMTTQIQQGLNITEKLSDQAYSVDQSAQLLQDSASTIRSNFIVAQNIISMYIYQLEKYLSYVQNFSQTYFTNKFSTLLFTIQIIVAICLIGTMLILIGAFSTSTFQILQCRKMVHIGWIIWSCSFLGGLILIYIFLGLGSVSYEFCEYYRGVLQGQDVYSDIKSQNSQNILNKLQVCMYGNGNVLQSFQIDDQIKTLSNLYNHIILYDKYTNSSSSEYVNISLSIQNIEHWISNIQSYKIGLFIDSNPLQTNEDNPNYAIQQLNLYSNTGGGVPTCTKDKWVWDRTNCTNSSQITYITTDQTNGANITTSQVVCISFNEGYSTNLGRKWNMEDFTKRYVQIRESCRSAYDSIVRFGKTLIDFRDSRIDLFQGIQDSLNEILELNQDFNELLNTFRSRVTQFSDSTKTLKNLLISESIGIKFTTNCKVVGQKVRDTYTVYCRNFMSQVVRIGIFSIILTILILFGIWMGSLFAVRYSDIQKNQRMNMPQSQTDSQRIISDKKSSDSD